MVIAALILAGAIVNTDQFLHDPESALFNWISNMGPGGARAVFATVAGSTITVAGTIFSIAMVVLSMASSQFGPRLVPTFMRVGKIQFGIGIFIGVFVYCLIMLTYVPAENKAELLPVWGVVGGLVLGICAFLVLIMLIHEIAHFIQAQNITDRVYQDIETTFSRVFPPIEEQLLPSDADTISSFEASGQECTTLESGYIQTIDFDALVEVAAKYNCVIQLVPKPGEYLIRGQTLAWVEPFGALENEQLEQVRSYVTFGRSRSLAQDAEYAIDQMVEIAVRALSPGINDPFTAMNCIDKLSSALGFLSTRQLNYPYRTDQNAGVRVILKPESYHSIVHACFNLIRQNAAGQESVMIRMADAVVGLTSLNLSPKFHHEINQLLIILRESFADKFSHDQDLQDFNERCDLAQKQLDRMVEEKT